MKASQECATEQSESAQPVYSAFADDPDFAELIEFFVDAVPERCAALRQSYELNDISQLKTIAHQLKGAGGGYGFSELSEHAARLEQACKENAPSEIEELLATLISFMNRISA